ncbi:hypothetical protein WJX75_001190 [Coccomyxa subellipsoidea]|uniref:Uncharacterized protein n=1 Tax=Coccomyxa subellipsoidea TaxID=248742 RepID=A0ABR2YFV0_9CHLO
MEDLDAFLDLEQGYIVNRINHRIISSHIRLKDWQTYNFFPEFGHRYRAQLVDKVVGRNGKIKVNRIKRIRDLQCEPRVIEVVHPDWYRVQMVLNGWTWAEEPMPTTHIQTATKVFEHKLATARKFKYAEDMLHLVLAARYIPAEEKADVYAACEALSFKSRIPLVSTEPLCAWLETSQVPPVIINH